MILVTNCISYDVAKTATSDRRRDSRSVEQRLPRSLRERAVHGQRLARYCLEGKLVFDELPANLAHLAP